MPNDLHYIGRIENGQCVDLYGSEASSAEPGENEGDIVEVRGTERSVLANGESARAALYLVAAKHKLSPLFPKAVVDEVAELQVTHGIDAEDLVDRVADPFVTIDGADSKDLDQAVFVEAEGDGHVVHYALADAAYYVKPGTALHREALERGASYYLPGIMIPMLPRELSEGLVSLNPHVDRRALVFSMHVDGEGHCTKTRVAPSRIRSQGKLSFEEVQNFYDEGSGFSEAVAQSLRHLAVVGARRMSLAEERGVVRYRRHEVRAKLASGGVRFTATAAVRRQVELYNEQLSLMCNTEGARLLAESGGGFVEPIYRVHPAPSEERMESFLSMLGALVDSQGLDAARWKWSQDDPRSLREFLDALPTEGREGRIAMAIHRQAVMANVKSTFQTEAGSHHGVGADVYARFSAPMREMVGVFLHRELLEAQAGDGHEDAELRALVVAGANAAKSLQRTVSNEGNRLVLEQLFREAQESGESLIGTLMGIEGHKAYVRLDSPPIDIKVYLKLATEILVPNDEDTALLRDGSAVLRLGDKVSVLVRGRHEVRDRWILELSP